jgi:glyoxylase-like metal-dependent hydrolase (beta-lactamase superfamily II)
MQIYKGIRLIKEKETDANIYLIDDELLIDTGTGKYFHEMKALFEDRYEPEKIKTIICTHAHFDHTGGAKKFRDWLGAKIYLHESDRQAVESGATLAESFGECGVVVMVDGVLADKQHIKTTNFDFEVISTPGHTPGSICLYDKEKGVLISGDTLFSDNIGRFDLIGGSITDMMNSLLKLSDLKVERLLPGHGNFRVDGFSFLIKQMINRVQRELK